jgi:hypothetical protein
MIGLLDGRLVHFKVYLQGENVLENVDIYEGNSESKVTLFTCIDVSGGKNFIRIPLDISPLLFLIVPELVQILVIIYDEIFQALAVEGDVLLSKPFLDPTPPIVQTGIGMLGLSRV